MRGVLAACRTSAIAVAWLRWLAQDFLRSTKSDPLPEATGQLWLKSGTQPRRVPDLSSAPRVEHRGLEPRTTFACQEGGQRTFLGTHSVDFEIDSRPLYALRVGDLQGDLVPFFEYQQAATNSRVPAT